MMMHDLRAHLEEYAHEVDADMRRMVRSAEQQRVIDLDRYGLLRSLETLLIAADATCQSIIAHQDKKGVPV